jgi:hypothetical protein
MRWGPIDNSAYAAQQCCAKAHHAGLKGCIEGAFIKSPAPPFFCCFCKRSNFCMSKLGSVFFNFIIPLTNNDAVW